ncbi:MAG: Ig-like domain-containing protein, partial [Bacteroidales bacterium]|nr:Ig-like domain-containing protein [Bacteroidales bacterium]
LSVNDAPTAVNDTLSTLEDNSLVISPLNNDVDTEDTVLIDFTMLAHARLGSIEIDSLNLIYTPNPNVWGRDSMTYVVRDAQRAMSEEATIYITIDSVNEAPVLVDIAVAVNEDKNDTTFVLVDALDPDFSTLQLLKVEAGLFGNVSQLGDQVVYSPLADFNGKDTVAYSVIDGESDTTEAYLYYTVHPVNDAPVAVNDTMTTFEDHVLVFSPMANDVDAEDSALIDFTILTLPRLGTVGVDSLDIVYTPQVNIWGQDSMTYVVRDAQGEKSEEATIYFTIDSVNEAPILKNINILVTEDRTDTTFALATAKDPDFSGLRLATIGEARFGKVRMLGDSVIYTPQADFIGRDTVVYCVHDGENDTTLAYLCYHVIPVNDAPIANDDTLRLMEDSPASIFLLENDTDAEDTILNHFTVVDKPAKGSYTTDSVTVFYTPHPNVWGLDSLTYQVADQHDIMSNLATVYFFIDSVNEAPIAFDTTISIMEDRTDTIDVITIAQSPDASAITLVELSTATKGSAFIGNGKIVYTPATDFNGRDSLMYTIVDGEGDSATAQLNFVVSFVNDAPIAFDDNYTHTIENNLWTAIILPVANNDIDPDLASAEGQVIVDLQPKYGNAAVSINPLEITYTPRSGFVGVDSLAYHLLDTFGAASNRAWVYIEISKLEARLRAVSDTIVVMEDAYFDFNPIANDFGSSTDSIFLKMDSIDLKDTRGMDWISTPNGSIKLQNDSIWHYHPVENFYGADTAHYLLSNDYGDVDTGMIIIDVLPINDAPWCESHPQVSGIVLPDSVLYCDEGIWSDVDGTMTYAYQWFAIGEAGRFSIANSTDSLIVGDSLLGTDVYCEVMATDDGYPLPGMSIVVSSDTIATTVYRPAGIRVSQDTIYRTWEDKQLVAILDGVDSAHTAHAFELLNGIDTFEIVGNALYLDTAADYIDDENVTLSIKITPDEMGGLSAIFDVNFTIVDDLMPVMKNNYPFIAEILGDSVSVAVMADKSGSVYYQVQELGGIVPKAEEMHHAQKSSLVEENEMLIGIGDLVSQKQYEMLIYLVDTSGNHYSQPYLIPFSAMDIVAPEFIQNSPYVLHCTEDSAIIVVQLDEIADLSYTLYENDMTVAATGVFSVDSALVEQKKLRLEHANNEYCIFIGGLRSQIAYQIVLSAKDTLKNVAEDVALDFCTNDTVAPFFPGRRPYIKSIIDGRINYKARSSEEGQLYTRLAYASDAASDFTAYDPLGIYSETSIVEENEILSVETTPLMMDGDYRLDFLLEDSVGNLSVIRSVAFTYPENLGMELENALIYQDEDLSFMHLASDAQYEIITMKGAILRAGTLSTDNPTVAVSRLSDGTYLIHVSNSWENRTFRFVKSTRNRPGVQ